MKKKFIEEPGQMKLLIVVDKLLTGFDAPPATYLYIDKQMRDHGLFQAICRVNRLDGDDKEYGYIIDYKDLFKSLEGAVQRLHVRRARRLRQGRRGRPAGDRLGKARERLEETQEAVKALCEPVEPPQGHGGLSPLLLRARIPATPSSSRPTSRTRLALYKHVAALLRAFANLANELPEAGYSRRRDRRPSRPRWITTRRSATR